jgi:uncharacterized membrane protein
MHPALLATHITAGVLGIGFGFVALFVAKGAWLHRRSGTVFVYAMLVMTLLGAAMAAVWGRQPMSNIPVALLTAYLVVTALTTVRPPGARSGALDRALLLLATGVALALFTFGGMALRSPKGAIAGIPAPPFFIFGTVALLAAIGDLRMIRAGGVAALRGAPRITRHLWRMSLALIIAAFSFFLGQSQVFPKPIRIVPLLAIPPLVALAAMLYWVWRIRLRRRLAGITVAGAPASGTAATELPTAPEALETP